MNTADHATVHHLATILARPRLRPFYRLVRRAKCSLNASDTFARHIGIFAANRFAAGAIALRLNVISPAQSFAKRVSSAIGAFVKRSGTIARNGHAIAMAELRLKLIDPVYAFARQIFAAVDAFAKGSGIVVAHSGVLTVPVAGATQSDRPTKFQSSGFYSGGTFAIASTSHSTPRRAAAKRKSGATPFDRLRILAIGAFSIVFIFVIGFGLWATFAPLESAAIASGAVEAESSRKTIQHLEGGIIGRILVKDGDEVATGQPLIRLDDTRAYANVLVLQMQLLEAQALEARLLAERDGRTVIDFPQVPGQVAQDTQEFTQVTGGQVKIFETRRKLQASRIEVIQQRKAQTEQEIAGLRFQAAATLKRSAIIKEELSGVAPLVAKGLQTRVRLLRLEREQAEIEGRYGDILAQISRAEQSIGESQAMILKLESDQNTEVAQSLRDTQALIAQLDERIQAASDILARTIIRAPEAGTVTDLRIHTPGGVVVAGEPLLDLVPRQDRLIVRALVKPEDIDLVRPGLEARVRLLSYKHRRVPPVDGVLTYVSADSLVSKETERAYYTARVRIDEASLRSLPDVEIMPGMPVEVMIKTGEFTVAHYALRPVFDSFNRAFRED
jgi:HlyD family secretion protein